MKNRMLFASFLLFWFGASRAEEAGGAVRIRAVALGEIPEVHVATAGGVENLEAPAAYLGQPVRVAGDAPVRLLRRDEETSDGFAPLATVALPEDAPEVLLLLAPGRAAPGGAGSLLVVALPLDNERFPPGSYLLFNRSEAPILFMLDGVMTRIPPGERRRVQPSQTGPRAVSVQFMAEDEPDRESLVTTTWFHGEANRELVFFTPGEDGKTIQVRTFPVILMD